METKFTPGPWECGTYLPESYRVWPRGRPDYRTKSPDEFFSNATLIAAAPDMYKALRGLINCHPGAAWQTEEVRRKWWLKAKAALDKADGK